MQISSLSVKHKTSEEAKEPERPDEASLSLLIVRRFRIRCLDVAFAVLKLAQTPHAITHSRHHYIT